MFDHTQKLHWQNTKHPEDDLKNSLCSVKKKNSVIESIFMMAVFYVKKKMTENLKLCKLFFKEYETSAFTLITVNLSPPEAHPEYL